MIQLLYVSRIAASLNPAAIQQILGTARRKNQLADITGCLLLTRSHFAQALEGRADEVNQLLRVISADPRHTDVRLICSAEIQRRLFPEWEMGYVFNMALADRIGEAIEGPQLTAEASQALLGAMTVDPVAGPISAAQVNA